MIYRQNGELYSKTLIKNRTGMILEFQNVTGKQKDFHLQDITFSLEAGYLMGISGKNGAGKSTLLKYIIDQNINYEGQILVFGKDIQKNRTELMNEIGFISEENPFIKKMSAQKNGEIFGTLYHRWSQKLFETASVVLVTHIKEELERRMDYILHLEQGKMLFFKENREEDGVWTENSF